MKVCDCCFHDEEIKRFITSTSNEYGTCECCSEEGNLIDVNEILDFFSEFISIFKHDEVEGKPLIEIIQNDWGIFSSVEVGEKIFSDSAVSIVLDLDMGLALSESTFSPYHSCFIC